MSFLYFPLCFFFLKNGPTPASFSFIFGIFKQTSLQFLQQIYTKCPSSIRYWDSNPWPSERESLPITTRPGLPPNPSLFLFPPFTVSVYLSPFLFFLFLALFQFHFFLVFSFLDFINRIYSKGGSRHSSVVSSAPSILHLLWPWVQIPSKPSMYYDLMYFFV